jgi:hypothetical protein
MRHQPDEEGACQGGTLLAAREIDREAIFPLDLANLEEQREVATLLSDLYTNAPFEEVERTGGKHGGLPGCGWSLRLRKTRPATGGAVDGEQATYSVGLRAMLKLSTACRGRSNRVRRRRTGAFKTERVTGSPLRLSPHLTVPTTSALDRNLIFDTCKLAPRRKQRCERPVPPHVPPAELTRPVWRGTDGHRLATPA